MYWGPVAKRDCHPTFEQAQNLAKIYDFRVLLLGPCPSPKIGSNLGPPNYGMLAYDLRALLQCWHRVPCSPINYCPSGLRVRQHDHNIIGGPSASLQVTTLLFAGSFVPVPNTAQNKTGPSFQLCVPDPKNQLISEADSGRRNRQIHGATQVGGHRRRIDVR